MYLGVDIGSQSVKAIVVDRTLSPLGYGNVPLSFTARPGNVVEQDPHDWLKALRPAIIAALSEAGVSADSILGIGLGAQLDGCVPVDPSGKALHACMTWMDRRATKQANYLPEDVIRQRCGVIRDPAHMGPKIAWLRENRPEVVQIAYCFHQPVSFVVQHLTGRAVMDRALASTTMFYDLAQKDWADDLLTTFGADRDRLPSLSDMGDCAGVLSENGAKITGLKPGIKVAVGTGDDFTNAIGAGLLVPGVMLCQIGTGEVVGALHPEQVVDDQRLVETHGFTGGYFFIENPGWLSGGAITWLVKLLRLTGVDELNDLAAAVAPGADGVLFLPALTGAMAPEWNADVHACFQNLSAHHGAGHLARAMLEGTAFAMHDVQLRLAGMGISFDSIRLAGGGASSSLWAQIRADVAQLPVQVCTVKDASPLGAAVLGAVAAGEFETIGAAEPHLNRDSTWITPSPTIGEIYQESHRKYKALYSHLKLLAAGNSPLHASR